MIALALVLIAQTLPPELAVKSRPGYDPALPPELRAVVEKAVAAELDKTRGPGNAVDALRLERSKYERAPLLQLAIDLRIAATVLRQQFLANSKVSEEDRYAQALSTYSRLDLTDPGLDTWFDRAVAHGSAEAKAAFGDTRKRQIPLAIEARGSGLDKKDLSDRFRTALKSAGLTMVAPTDKQPGYLARLAALEVRDEGGQATVRVTLEVEATKWTFKKASFRTTTAPDAKAAVTAAAEWLIRIGGRDMVFDWFDRNGIKGAVLTGPESVHDHDHDHGGANGAQLSFPGGGQR